MKEVFALAAGSPQCACALKGRPAYAISRLMLIPIYKKGVKVHRIITESVAAND